MMQDNQEIAMKTVDKVTSEGGVVQASTRSINLENDLMYTSSNWTMRSQRKYAAMHSAIQTVAATTLTAAAAENLFGSTRATIRNECLTMPVSSSPFGGNSSGGAHHAIRPTLEMTESAISDSLALPQKRHNNHHVLPTTSRSILVLGSPMAVLFGTKTYMKELSESSSSSHTEILSSAVAGAASGLLAGLVQGVHNTSSAAAAITGSTTHRPPLFHLASNKSSRFTAMYEKANPLHFHLARHAIAATLYFGTYDHVREVLSSSSSSRDDNATIVSNNNNDKNIDNKIQKLTDIACAGGVAGIVHATVLGWKPQSCVSSSLRRVFTPTLLLRTAPTHAFIFSGYEAMQQWCRSHNI